MKEIPILFSSPMVRAILEDRKTQTRRVIKPQPYHDAPSKRWVYAVMNGGAWQDTIKSPVAILHCCPYSQGDQLWVRESLYWDADFGWRYSANDGMPSAEEADKLGEYSHSKTSCPSIFMKREASRITLQIESVSVERVQDIIARDAIEEGIDFKKHECGCEVCAHSTKLCPATSSSLIMEFAGLWESINAKRRFGWDANPWVFVLKFKRLPSENRAAVGELTAAPLARLRSGEFNAEPKPLEK